MKKIIKLMIMILMLGHISIVPALSFGVGKQYDEVLIKLKNSEKIYDFSIKAYKNLDEFIEINRLNKTIEYIEPNYEYKMSAIPNDEFFNQQPYLSEIGMPWAWDLSTGLTETVIAIIDTGVDIDHPDIRNNVWWNIDEVAGNNIDDDNNGYIDDINGWDFFDKTADPRPKFGDNYSFLAMNHGTIVAGVAAAQGNNNIGVSGVSWRSRIMSLRVLGSDGKGSTLEVAEAIDYAVDNGADIINLSFVGEGRSITLEQAIERAYEAGVLVVAAAGNEVESGIDMTNNPRYPVCHDGGRNNNWVIGVASTDSNNRLASFSNYGDCIDVVAPGVGIFSTLLKEEGREKFNREYGGLWAGTSVSAPQISGIAALIKSLKPSLNLAEMQKLLLNNNDNIDKYNRAYIGKLGTGKINAFRVLAAARDVVSQIEHKTDKIVVVPNQNGGPQVRIFTGSEVTSQFFAFDSEKRMGLNIASADLDDNGLEEIIVGAGQGEEPWIKIFDNLGNKKIEFLAYDKSMKGGVNVAVGDIGNNGVDEIVVAAQSGEDSNIKIFSQTGELVREFYAFNQFYKGGLSLAMGDVNGDGFDDIVVGAGKDNQSFVKIFNYNIKLISQFIAYDPGYMKGINVAAGDINGDGKDEIITGTKEGATPHVRIFNDEGRVQLQFFAYNQKFFGGVNVVAGDVNGDGKDEIITGAGPGGGPHVRIFDDKAKVLGQFFAYDEKFMGGVRVSAGK